MDILNMNSFMRFPIAGRSDHARADPGAVLLLQRPGDPLGALPAARDARPAHQVDAHVHPRTGMTVGVALGSGCIRVSNDHGHEHNLKLEF